MPCVRQTAQCCSNARPFAEDLLLCDAEVDISCHIESDEKEDRCDRDEGEQATYSRDVADRPWQVFVRRPEQRPEQLDPCDGRHSVRSEVAALPVRSELCEPAARE